MKNVVKYQVHEVTNRCKVPAKHVMQKYIWWHSARLQYLHSQRTGDTPVLH